MSTAPARCAPWRPAPGRDAAPPAPRTRRGSRRRPARCRPAADRHPSDHRSGAVRLPRCGDSGRLTTPLRGAGGLRRRLGGRKRAARDPARPRPGGARPARPRLSRGPRDRREDGACRGCYPTDTSEITEDLNARTGDEYAAAATPFGARLPGVVYVDTAGAGRLARHADHALLAHVERDDLAAHGRTGSAAAAPRRVTGI